MHTVNQFYSLIKATFYLFFFLTLFIQKGLAQSICTNDTFVSIANAPIADLFRTVKSGNEVFVFSQQQSNKYDVNSNNWYSINQMPTPRADFGAAEVNGVVYCMGGFSASNGWSNKNEAYTIATNSWSTKANLPIAIAGCYSVSLNNKVYVLGGSLGNTVTSFYEYNPTTNQYITLANPLQHRMHTNLIVYNSKIYLVGGYFYNGNYTSINLLDEYDPLTNSWTPKAPLPSNLFNAGVTIYDNKLYVFGGTNTAPNWTPLNSLYVYSFNSNSWTSINSMPMSRSSLEAQTINDKVYLFGGKSTLSATTNTCFKYYCNTPVNLPVELINLSAFCDENSRSIRWQTASEMNTAVFEVEKSRDGIKWSLFETVQAAGNSTQLLNYSIQDDDENKQSIVYYRLNQKDINGTSKLYGPISSNCAIEKDFSTTIYPNPTMGNFVLNISNPQDEHVAICVIDMLGHEITTVNSNLSLGENLIPMTLSNLNKGFYVINLKSNSYDQSMKLIIE
jgi:N-acetylneuraminic acid mutarotase